jgi:hypothetical protein
VGSGDLEVERVDFLRSHVAQQQGSAIGSQPAPLEIAEIDRVSIATRQKERVILLKGVSRVAMPESGAPWNGVAPDGSSLIMRDVGSREIYSLALQLP